ncbi:MAG: NAD(P)-dependent oxidoreductase [Immundisolibacteraceae bacterium]|nr:NAD(P)-dependent oxidoreductase [Immundisolibacteraceae bacterium]
MEVFNIGFIGLGVMGQPIVARLVQAGHAVEVSDLSAEAVANAVAAGATAATNSSTIGAGKNLVFISVTNAAITEQIVCDPGGLLDTMDAGGIIVDLGTTPSPKCRELAQISTSKGKQFLDIPLSGSTPWAVNGTLASMIGGDRQAFDRIKPVIESFSDKINYLGESGSGQLLKLCHQLAFMSTLTGLAEAIALGERSGHSAATVLKTIGDCVSPRHVIDFMLPMAEADAFDQGGGSLAIGHKDLKAVLATAEEAGIRLPLTETVFGYFDKALTGGREKTDMFGVVQLARDEFYAD